MRSIHSDQGYDHDRKYSLWRRNAFKQKVGRTDLYCADIDWVEWRTGQPVDLTECRRAIGVIKDAEAAVEHFKNLNNGFQYELIACLSYRLPIPAYIVGIEDPNVDNSTLKDYPNARFVVERIIPPDSWPGGRNNLSAIRSELVGKMDEEQYIHFIANL